MLGSVRITDSFMSTGCTTQGIRGRSKQTAAAGPDIKIL